MKILVVGSRDFHYYELMKTTLDNLVKGKDNIEIVSGGANGAGSLAEKYARERDFALKVFPAYWGLYGKRAGYIRNRQMHKYISEYSDRLCVAFWDGKSKGTAHSFELAKEYNNPLKVEIFGQMTNGE